MTPTWHGVPEPPFVRPSLLGWVRFAARAIPIAVLFLTLALIHNVLRLIERPLHREHRPWTPYITRFAFRQSLRLIGLRLHVEGHPMTGPGALVANHSSWLDIFVLNATDRLYFVSKAEVAGWPLIGWLSRIVNTVFIERDPAQAAAQSKLLQDRLLAGHRLLFFPEGTSTDNQRLLPFKSSLFEAFRADELRDVLRIQPVTVIYKAPKDQLVSFYGWWGDMTFDKHMLSVMSATRQGTVEVFYHRPIVVADHPNRKALARACEEAVRAGLIHLQS